MPNPNYRDTITIYNCLKAKDNDTKADQWYPTVLTGCFFQSTVAQTVNGQTLSMASSYLARIPDAHGDNAAYMPYAEWAALPDKKGYFTVSENDVIIKGSVVQNITGKSPNTMAELLASRKPEAFRVRVFKDNTGFPVGKHYRVSGV